jgi:hypothetical protein
MYVTRIIWQRMLAADGVLHPTPYTLHPTPQKTDLAADGLIDG